MATLCLSLKVAATAPKKRIASQKSKSKITMAQSNKKLKHPLPQVPPPPAIKRAQKRAILVSPKGGVAWGNYLGEKSSPRLD